MPNVIVSMNVLPASSAVGFAAALVRSTFLPVVVFTAAVRGFCACKLQCRKGGDFFVRDSAGRLVGGGNSGTCSAIAASILRRSIIGGEAGAGPPDGGGHLPIIGTIAAHNRA